MGAAKPTKTTIGGGHSSLGLSALMIMILALIAPPVLYSFDLLPSSLNDFIELNIPLNTKTPGHLLSSLFSNNKTTSIAGADGTDAPFVCEPHTYTTEIISLDPFVIYITSFLSAREITALLAVGDPRFAPSSVVKHGRKLETRDRTSSSAGLPPDDPAVRCILDRAAAFMGEGLLEPGRSEIGPPQLVRYTKGQKFNVHHDWYERPQVTADAEKRERLGGSWNRIASFFAILQDGCSGGETHFPYLKPLHDGDESAEGKRRRGSRTRENANATWFQHEDGGVAFRPVKGNAVFWVNLHANGTGDSRTMHAGLALGEGLKTAMNIWPRVYYP